MFVNDIRNIEKQCDQLLASVYAVCIELTVYLKKEIEKSNNCLFRYHWQIYSKTKPYT